MTNDAQNSSDSSQDDIRQGADMEDGQPRNNADESFNNPDSDTNSAEKDPDDWTTGDEPATAAQKSYINTMSVETGDEVPFELTKAEASKKIEELQKKTGRDGDTLAPQ